jgi:hypothetical protein
VTEGAFLSDFSYLGDRIRWKEAEEELEDNDMDKKEVNT